MVSASVTCFSFFPRRASSQAGGHLSDLSSGNCNGCTVGEIIPFADGKEIASLGQGVAFQGAGCPSLEANLHRGFARITGKAQESMRGVGRSWVALFGGCALAVFAPGFAIFVVVLLLVAGVLVRQGVREGTQGKKQGFFGAGGRGQGGL